MGEREEAGEGEGERGGAGCARERGCVGDGEGEGGGWGVDEGGDGLCLIPAPHLAEEGDQPVEGSQGLWGRVPQAPPLCVEAGLEEGQGLDHLPALQQGLLRISLSQVLVVLKL